MTQNPEQIRLRKPVEKDVPISTVIAWEKNPRTITTEDYEDLKSQIMELGIYKRLLVFKRNGKHIVLGGNMRLKALQEIGVDEVGVAIVQPKDEAEKLKYALSDNDRKGEYIEDELAELIASVGEVDLGAFKIDLGEPLKIDDLMAEYMPDDGGEINLDDIIDDPDDAEADANFVAFRFGDYSGLVDRALYNEFRKHCEKSREDGEVNLDNTIKAWVGSAKSVSKK